MIQTPLAICQNRIEMMMEDDALTEQQMIELAKMQQTMAELTTDTPGEPIQFYAEIPKTHKNSDKVYIMV